MALPVCKKDLGRAQLVQLSTSSLVEHSIAHPEIGITDYQRLQKMLDEGELYEQEDRRVVLLSDQGKLYRAAIKVDMAREQVFLLSLFTTEPSVADRQVRKVMRRLR